MLQNSYIYIQNGSRETYVNFCLLLGQRKKQLKYACTRGDKRKFNFQREYHLLKFSYGFSTVSYHCVLYIVLNCWDIVLFRINKLF